MGASDQGKQEQRDLSTRQLAAAQTYRWVTAILVAHNDGNLGPLIALLRSDVEMIPVARRLLAALLERRRLVKKRGGQLTPMFKMSAEHRLALAAKTAKGLQAGTTAVIGERRRKMSRAEAIEKTAQLHALNVETLANYMDGKRGASRRRKQRRAAASAPRPVAAGRRKHEKLP